MSNYLLQICMVFLLLGGYGFSTYPATPQLEILVVTDKFPWSSRPFINNQIKSLLDKGHKLWVWCTHERKFSENKMPACLQPYDWQNKIFYKQLPPKRDFDVMLCQFGDKGLSALKRKKEGKLTGKIVTCFRGEDVTARLKKDPHRYDELLREGDLFFPVCEFFRQKLITVGRNPNKIRVVHSAIDCNKFMYKERTCDLHREIQLISVNRLTAKKGTLFSILAVALLKEKYPTLTYTIVGDGPLYDYLTYFIEQLGASNYIKLVGKLPHDTVADKLSKAHIFLLHSVTPTDGNTEGIPNVLMEAMASGMPVVSTFHAGIPELVTDGESGFLVAERDVFGFMEKIAHLIEHPELCISMGQKGRAHVEQEHNTYKENEKLEQLLVQLCN